MSAPQYDHERIAQLRAQGWTWAEVSTQFPGATGKQLRQAHNRWSSRQREDPFEISIRGLGIPNTEPAYHETTLTTDDLHRIKSLDDLLTFYDVDPEEWEVKEFWVTGNSWDQSETFVAHQYKVKAHLVRRVEKRRDAAVEIIQEALADLAGASSKPPVVRITPPSEMDRESALAVIAIQDPHFGMLAWGDEVGENQDTGLAVKAYTDAVSYLLSVVGNYDLEKILFLVGNDLMHVDGMATDAKGNRRGGATTRGTAQDLDTRLKRLFRKTRECLVGAIDQARVLAPVEALVVPGNHDEDSMFKLGEVLEAWYRHDPEVQVLNTPMKRKYYGWGRNVWMFTHGEELRRQRDNLALIFATECPPLIWTAGDRCREVITGHNHVNLQGKYHPTSEVSETRAIRVRSLPALTAEDSWHYEEGYKHRRSGTALVYRQSGGVLGIHEFNV